jgi:tetratricopeptide (TPR) repeat protein
MIARPDQTDSLTAPVPALTNELDLLKTEQESLRALLGDAPSKRPGDSNRNAESAKRLRMQLDQLTADLAVRQNQSRAQKKRDSSGSAGPEAQGKPVSAVSELFEDEMTPSAAERQASGRAGKPVDPLALGQVLLRMEDYDGAVQAFRAVEFAKLRSDDRAYAKYLLATALRSAGQTHEALPLYREVANSKADSMIAECARWQLSLLQWRRDLETQLDALRQRRKSLASDDAAQLPNALDTGQPDADKELHR